MRQLHSHCHKETMSVMTKVTKMKMTKMKHTKMKRMKKTIALYLAGRLPQGVAEAVVVAGQSLSCCASCENSFSTTPQ